jgi:hypothetical protein
LKDEMKQQFRNYLIIALFGAAACVGFYLFQPQNQFADNPKADANEYLKIYEFFQGSAEWENVRFAIHNRLVIPFLASLLPWQSPSFNFFVINSLLAILSLLALYYLLEYFHTKRAYSFLILVFFSLHYVGPFRQNAIGPINVDMAVYLFEILFLLFLLKRKYLLLILIAPVAIATKELFLALIIAILALALAMRFIFNDKSISIPALVTTLLIGIFTKLLLSHYFESASPGRNSVLVMAFHIREMIFHPDHLWRWILSLFAAMGGYLFLVIKRYRRVEIKKDPVLIVHVLSLSVLALSIVGGMDYTRLIFLGFPYLILSVLLTRPNRTEFLIAWVMSMPLTRFWVVMPIISLDMTQYNLWMPESADTSHLVVWTIVMILCLAIFLYLMKYLTRRAQS